MSTKPPAIPTGWRRLRKGDRVRHGDRLYESKTKTWHFTIKPGKIHIRVGELAIPKIIYIRAK